MPPKRKQADNTEGSSSTRATRASTRSVAAKNTSRGAAASRETRGTSSHTADGVASSNGDGGEDSDAMESVHSAKRARTSGPASNKTRKSTAKASKTRVEIDDEPTSNRKSTSTKELPQNVSNSRLVSHPEPTAAKSVAKKGAKLEPYSPQRALVLFESYADSDNKDVIGPAEFEQLCNDAHMSLEGSQPLIFAWQMGAKEMAKITREEWAKGTSNLKISSTEQLSLAISELERLLIDEKPATKGTHTKGVDYDRGLYHSYASDPKAAFRKLYQFSFLLAKPEESKNIDMETSVALWNVLLVPKYPIMAEVLRFIDEKKTYKATNKDLWSMMLEFCETVRPDLQDYEAEEAWPTLLDDFFAWKKSQTGPDDMAIDSTD